MKIFSRAFGVALLALAPAAAGAAEIRGDYVEARNADVFTGPCFSNAEVFIYGKQAVLAWKVREGSWKGVDLAGPVHRGRRAGRHDFFRGSPR